MINRGLLINFGNNRMHVAWATRQDLKDLGMQLSGQQNDIVKLTVNVVWLIYAPRAHASGGSLLSESLACLLLTTSESFLEIYSMAIPANWRRT